MEKIIFNVYILPFIMPLVKIDKKNMFLSIIIHNKVIKFSVMIVQEFKILSTRLWFQIIYDVFLDDYMNTLLNSLNCKSHCHKLCGSHFCLCFFKRYIF